MHCAFVHAYKLKYGKGERNEKAFDSLVRSAIKITALVFSKIDIDQWTNVLATVQDKTRWLYAQRGVGYVAIFINQG
jgi:hypothetical protein